MSSNTVYLYKRTTDVEYWQTYLKRRLTHHEKSLLATVKNEHELNAQIKTISDMAFADNLYIPSLTKLDGNCLFESFQILEFCTDHTLFRKGFAQLLLLLKNVKNFLPDVSESMGAMHSNFTEIHHVKCLNTGKIYNYDYDAMCVDLSNNSNWTRLNTELIMRAMCVIFNIIIKIYHHNGFVTEIFEIENEHTVTIHLGQTGDYSQACDNGFHYIPLKPIESNYNLQPIAYNSELKKFHQWAQEMATLTNRVMQQTP